MPGDVHLFGVRHHGPGSARSVLRALESLRPDALLIEGPPDATDLLPMLADEGMIPPVALLIYAEKDPSQAVYYPFVEFSPEYQAIRFALRAKIPIRLIDLPQRYSLALQASEKPQTPEESPDTL